MNAKVTKHLSESSVFVIAEAGVNHNGSLDMALQLVDAAADAGADAVKFQTFSAERLVNLDAKQADYQRAATGGDTQYEMLKALELTLDMHFAIKAHCEARNVFFLSTPFDEQSLAFLLSLDIGLIKMSSGDLTNAPLLLAASRAGRPVILSTGMGTLAEVEQALGVLAWGFTHPHGDPSIEDFEKALSSTEGAACLREKVTLLHCTTEYPAPFDEVNLRAMDTLRQAFGLPVGYSDHTPGIAIPVAAVAREARVIEKHFTLNRTLPGPDHKASLEPDELAAMVKSIRQVEIALGNGRKWPQASEIGNRAVARRSLVAAQDIARGETYSSANLAVRRPAGGLPPMFYWSRIGKPANRDYRAGDLIEP